MAQIQKGTTYQTGDSVTADNLNAHVAGATLLNGCITEQVELTSPTTGTLLLASNGSALWKTTVASIITGASLFQKNSAQTLTQNIALTSGADISLASDSVMSLAAGAQISLSSGAILTLGQDPVSNLQAVPKQYADSKFLPLATGGLVSGSITMIGTSSMLTLSADPVSNLQAATKQYADKAGFIKAWVNFNGTGTASIRGSHNVSSITENGTGDYTINFTTPMSNANYSVAGAAGKLGTTTGRGSLFELYHTNPLSVSSARIRTMIVDTNPGVADCAFVTAQICG
jgi:hypothetical protein